MTATQRIRARNSRSRCNMVGKKILPKVKSTSRVFGKVPFMASQEFPDVANSFNHASVTRPEDCQAE